MGKTSTDTAFAFKSSLKTGAERFLSQALAHVLAQGFRTPDDFLRHFKPLDLMVALESAHDLRAEILVKAAGVHQKIAIKKTTSLGVVTFSKVKAPTGTRSFRVITSKSTLALGGASSTLKIRVK